MLVSVDKQNSEKYYYYYTAYRKNGRRDEDPDDLPEGRHQGKGAQHLLRHAEEAVHAEDPHQGVHLGEANQQGAEAGAVVVHQLQYVDARLRISENKWKQ